ncbi:hypothetical protein D3C71_1099660 [compost metagenome]
MRSFMPLMSVGTAMSLVENTARMPVMPQPRPMVPVSRGSTSSSLVADGCLTSLATAGVERTRYGALIAAMLDTREPSSAAWIQPMSSAPDCNCCIIAASLPSWPEWKTVTLSRPSVSFLSASPNCSAARFQEWPAGVISPRRNSLASAARTSAGKPSPVTVAAATAWRWMKWRRVTVWAGVVVMVNSV